MLNAKGRKVLQSERRGCGEEPKNLDGRVPVLKPYATVSFNINRKDLDFFLLIIHSAKQSCSSFETHITREHVCSLRVPC